MKYFLLVLVLVLSAGCATRAQIAAMSPEDRAIYYQRMEQIRRMGHAMQQAGAAMRQYDNSHLNQNIRMRTDCRVYGRRISCD